MEGQEWFDESYTNDSDMSLGYAIKFRRENPTVNYAPVIYGRGGIHRYFIRPGGRVDFSKCHGSEKAKRAEELGFYIH